MLQLGKKVAVAVNSRRRGPSRWDALRIGFIGATCSLCLAAGEAHAQSDVKQVDPFFVVVTSAGAPMRSADGVVYYPVRTLKAGEVLRIDGERGGWLRAEYLPGTRALVPTRDGTLQPDNTTVKLKAGSKLLAANNGAGGSWYPLLDRDLPAGTTFTDAQPLKAADGSVEGYLVPAPARARGFVPAEATRRASADEALTYTGPTQPKPPAPAPAATPAPVPAPAPTGSATSSTNAAPGPITPPVVTVPAGPGTSSSTVTMQNPSGTTTKTTTSTEPVPPGFEVVGETGRTTKVETRTSESSSTVTPIAGTSTQPAVTREADPVLKRIDDVNTLRALYDRGMRGDLADLDLVIRDFERSLSGMTGQAGANPALLNELNKRLEALRIRRDVLTASANAITSRQAIDSRMSSVRLALTEVQRQAIYTLVGKMVPSTVYDGSRGLPLLYRIEAPDTYSYRALGYVIPREELGFLAKTGRIVGLIGDSKMDPALGVTIVQPSRIDVLDFVEGKLIIESSQTINSSTINSTTTPSSALTPPPPPSPSTPLPPPLPSPAAPPAQPAPQ